MRDVSIILALVIADAIPPRARAEPAPTQPFWNAHAKQFIFAPAFDLGRKPAAATVHRDVRRWSRVLLRLRLTARSADADLGETSRWNARLKGRGAWIDRRERQSRLIGERQFHRAAAFAAMPASR
jgi:hypothetical protein